MIDINALIVGIIGVITTITSAWVSWFFARKKYYSEVDHNLIENMEQSLEFYKKLSDDNRARLNEMAERNGFLEGEIQELRKQVLDLTMNICMDLTCAIRVREKVRRNNTNGKNKNRLSETQSVSEGGCKST